MKEIIGTILLYINTISFVLVAIFGLTGIIYELIGPAGYEKIIERLKIPWRFEQIWIFFLIFSIVLILTYFLRKRFFR